MKDEQRPEGHVGDVGPVEDFKVTVPPAISNVGTQYDDSFVGNQVNFAISC